MTINIDNAKFYARELRRADADFSGEIDSEQEIKQALQLILEGRPIDELPQKYQRILRQFVDTQSHKDTAFNDIIDAPEVEAAVAELSKHYRTQEDLLQDFVYGTNNMNSKNIAQADVAPKIDSVASAASGRTEITSFADLLQDIAKTIPEIWAHYKTAKIDAATGRPLGDDNNTFSETVSYVMFQAINNNDRQTFDQVWDWARANIYHDSASLRRVYSINKRENIDAEARDYLAAWRYVGQGSALSQQLGKHTGVFQYQWDPNDPSVWFDGYDAAPDADILIAYTLLLADKKWGSTSGNKNYKGLALQILNDVWQSCVLSIRTGGAEVALKLNEHVWDTNIKNASTPNPAATASFANGQTTISFHQPYSSYGVHSLALADFADTYQSITIQAEKACAVKLMFQGKGGQPDYACDYNLKPGENIVPISAFKERHTSGDWNYKSPAVRIPGKATLDNFAMQSDRAGVILTITDIHLNRKTVAAPAAEHLFISANNKGSNVFNLSYFMPFALAEFSKVDRAHDWGRLFNESYKNVDAALSRAVPYRDAKPGGREYRSNGVLVPDWNAFTVEGLTSAYGTWDSFASGEAQDTHLSSWDALRLYTWAAYDYVQNGNAQSKTLLDKAGKFFADELAKNNWIYNAYNVDGTLPENNRRGAQSKSTPFGMGIALAVFCARDDQANALKCYKLLKENYTAGHFTTDADDYFTSNLIAFALNLFKAKYGI
ncbi:putative glycosyl hydrolases family 8 [Candidatus Termititenax persephonae]|uniref:Glycosyl hydrolases family 8 n=1 Tax=Candidatus Termititenax persephonae TaxID=2218525 RepID=A0A388TH80_9BACT|nr:putative glycosyl hydrolases family 8 [Candidatus Termititenax persephonae]